jgi:hypothetical protein
MGNFTNLPAQLAAMLQTGMLEREFEEGLDSVLAYRREALRETIPNRIGETITRTRTGRKVPQTTPINPATNTGLDNGMTASDASLEQYQFTMQEYPDTVDVDLMADEATIANNVIRAARNNGVQAAQSMERIARKKLFSAYLGGNTRVRTDLGAGSTTTCHVDDIRGFTTVLVNGVPTGISSANPITVQETSVSSGVTQVLTVTGYTIDASNASNVPDGISGVLTFNTATTPVNGDALVATNAPKVMRPYGHLTTAQMAGSDVFTLGIVQDAEAYLRDNGVPPMDDGTFHVILDNSTMRQLWADQDFKVLFAGRDQSPEFKNADVVSLLGLTFIPTTETCVQGTSTGATGAAAINTRIRRPIVTGAEHMIQGDFEGLEHWLARQGVDAIGDVTLVDGVAHIFRPPLDRLQKFLSLSWTWIGDFAIPTDLTATTSIIPTASNALYKRAVPIETAG